MSIDIRTPQGGSAGSVELPAEIFDVQANIPLIHQVVVAQLAAARQGTHDTKTRGEVSGGGRKPYRQKGTGRARQGSIRAPHYAGGGTAHDTSPAYPASDYATTSLRALQEAGGAEGSTFRKHYLLWANRCIYLKDITPSPEACRNTARTKGNGYPAMTLGALDTQLRAAYSTYERANACTFVSAMVLLGENREAIAAKARAAGDARRSRSISLIGGNSGDTGAGSL